MVNFINFFGESKKFLNLWLFDSYFNLLFILRVSPTGGGQEFLLVNLSYGYSSSFNNKKFLLLDYILTMKTGRQL